MNISIKQCKITKKNLKKKKQLYFRNFESGIKSVKAFFVANLIIIRFSKTIFIVSLLFCGLSLKNAKLALFNYFYISVIYVQMKWLIKNLAYLQLFSIQAVCNDNIIKSQSYIC